MEIYKLKVRVASDGVLKLELPVNLPDTDVEIAVIVHPTDTETREAARTAKGEVLDNIRQMHPRAYEPWDEAEERRLRILYKSNLTVNAIAGILQRQPGAIQSRLKKLGLTDSSDADKTRR